MVKLLKSQKRTNPELSDDQKDFIIRRATKGFSIRDCIKRSGFAIHDFTKYLRDNEEFRLDFHSAQTIGYDSLADELLAIPDDTSMTLGRAKLKSDNIKWILAKKRPSEYGDKIDLNINQTVDIVAALTQARSRSVSPIVLDGTKEAKGQVDLEIIRPKHSLKPANKGLIKSKA